MLDGGDDRGDSCFMQEGAGLSYWESETDPKTGKSRLVEVKVSGFFHTPAQVKDPKTEGSNALWLEFTDRRNSLIKTTVSAAEMHSHPREICARLAGLGLYIDVDCQKQFMRYLQGQMQRAPVADLAVSPGWVRPGVFALPGRIFGDGGDGGSRENGPTVYYGGESSEHKYHASGSYDSWLDSVADLCNGNSRLITAVSGGLAGPLMAEAGENSGGVHYFGENSIGKTTLLLAGGSVCGGGDPVNGFASSWRTTSNGLEPLLASHNDGAVFLDELGVADGKILHELIYSFANSAGKHRMTRDLSAAHTLRWRVMLFSTGEPAIASFAQSAGIRLAGGAAIRMIDVRADAGRGFGVFETLHGRSSPGALSDEIRLAALENYGWALPGFLRDLTGFSPEERRDLISCHRERFFSVCKMAGACPEVLRAAKRMAVIAAAGEIASSMDILPWSPGTAIDGVAECFRAWRESRGDERVSHDAAQAIAAVRAFIERNGASQFQRIGWRVSFSPSTSDDGVPAAPVVMRDQAGFVRRVSDTETEYLFFKEQFRARACNGLEPDFVLRSLAEFGYLKRQGRNMTVCTTVAGQKMTLYSVSSRILEEHEWEP